MRKTRASKRERVFPPFPESRAIEIRGYSIFDAVTTFPRADNSANHANRVGLWTFRALCHLELDTLAIL